jgi:hypothetical protein
MVERPIYFKFIYKEYLYIYCSTDVDEIRSFSVGPTIYIYRSDYKYENTKFKVTELFFLSENKDRYVCI